MVLVMVEEKEAGEAVKDAETEDGEVLAIGLETGRAAAVAGERRAQAGPAGSRNGAGNESWWDRISLTGAALRYLTVHYSTGRIIRYNIEPWGTWVLPCLGSSIISPSGFSFTFRSQQQTTGTTNRKGREDKNKNQTEMV